MLTERLRYTELYYKSLDILEKHFDEIFREVDI
jgi:hypothetical protein